MLNILIKLISPVILFFYVATRKFKMICMAYIIFLSDNCFRSRAGRLWEGPKGTDSHPGPGSPVHKIHIPPSLEPCSLLPPGWASLQSSGGFFLNCKVQAIITVHISYCVLEHRLNIYDALRVVLET